MRHSGTKAAFSLRFKPVQFTRTSSYGAGKFRGLGPVLMSLRAYGAIAALIVLSGCAKGAPDWTSNLSWLDSKPAPQPQAAAIVAPGDPGLHYGELRSGMSKAQLTSLYGARLILADTDSSYERYVVEPSSAVPGNAGTRGRLMLWLIDNRLATWAMEETSQPVAVAAVKEPATKSAATTAAKKPAATKLASAKPVTAPEAEPEPLPSHARASADRGNYMVQIAARRSEADARAAINDLRARHATLLGARGTIISRVSLPQGVFYRATVGPFASSIQANELCDALRAAGEECFVRGV